MIPLLLALVAPAYAGDPVEDVRPPPSARFSTGGDVPVSPSAWWEGLGDAELDAVIDRALDGNGDLGAAWARVDQAGGVTMQSGSALLPTLTANGTYSVTPADVAYFQTNGVPPAALFQGGGAGAPLPDVADPVPSLRGTLDARWALDLFGRNTLTWRASRYDQLAAKGDGQAQSLALSVLVAEAWYDHALAVERLDVVKAQVALNRDLLEVVQLRFGSDATALDVLQQKQQLASTQALLPGAEAMVHMTRQRLATLAGEDPVSWDAGTGRLPELEGLGELPALGTPADLLDNRPDLRAAAARLESSHKRKLSAQRALAPQLVATASWGRQWTTIFAGEGFDGPVANAGLSLSVPLFQGGRTWGEVKQTSAAERAAQQSFEQAVRAAVADVEASLATDRQARGALEAHMNQFEAARLAYDEARRQYLDGVFPFLNVQSALAARQGAELSLLQARRDAVSARIQLHESVGGPWTSQLQAPKRGGS